MYFYIHHFPPKIHREETVKVLFMPGRLVTGAISKITVIAMVTPEVYTLYRSAVHHSNNRRHGTLRNVPQPWPQHTPVELITTNEL